MLPEISGSTATAKGSQTGRGDAAVRKKLKIWLIALVALAATAAVGVTLAFMFRKANAVNIFTPAEVACAVHEKLDGADVTGSPANGNEKSDIRVRNTGNVKEYLRVRIVSYFVDTDGNVSGSYPSEFPDLALNDGWIAGGDHTYYYTKPVDPSGYTPSLCQPFTLIQKTTQDAKTVYQTIEVFAEAIQAEPGTAAENAWKVTVANDGTITAAP